MTSCCVPTNDPRRGQRARQITSPSKFNCKASRASNHSCSLLFVRTTAISPMPKGLIVCARRPEQIRRSSPMSMKMRLLGLLMSSMSESTGRSSRYLSSAHIRRWASPTRRKSVGEGDSMVPRVTLEMKPVRRSMLRIPRFCVVWSTAILWCRARKAFWTRAHRSYGKGIPRDNQV